MPATALTLPEAQQLLEELEIHQIELELQNEHLNATRQQLEAALRESSALYDFSPLGSLSLDSGGAITKLNLACASLLGAERARLTGTVFATHVVQKDRETFENLLQQALQSSDVEAGELELTGRPGGPAVLVEVRVLLLPDVSGWLIKMTDITDRKRAEEKLHAAELRWKLALDAAGDGMWAWNVSTGEVVFSSGIAYILGYNRADMECHVEDWNARIHPDDRAQVIAAYRSHLSGHAANFSSEHRCQCKDGSWKWLLSRGAVVNRGADGQARRMIGTYVDITSRKATESALLDALQFEQAVFDALSAQLAVIDSQGVVIQTNIAWRHYAQKYAGVSAGAGGCYLRYLDRITQQNTALCEAVTAGIAAVASGTLPHFQLPQPFFVAAGQRWFSMKVTPVLDAQRRVLVSHEDVTLLKAAELASLRLSNIDTLTGALSRNQFLKLAEQELARATRYQLPLMVLIMDLDQLKTVNDQFGHAAGDTVLQDFVKTVSGVLRDSDFIGRIGGGTFVVLLPNTQEQGGAVFGRRIVEFVRGRCAEEHGQRVIYTVSIGGCSLRGETSFTALLQAAEAALHVAKQQGRDRFELGRSASPSSGADNPIATD
jgi:diguanylate cyclase (GGDEF)-like protein/PAS domain S-box-containing protein